MLPQATTAHIALIAAVSAIALTALGPLAARLGLLPPIAGFGLFVAGLAGGGLAALILGGLALMRSSDPRGFAWLALVLGFFAVATLVTMTVQRSGAPAIHDITTDLDDPPELRQMAQLPANDGRDLSYPHGGENGPELQREAYPDLAPIELDLPPERAFELARRAVEELGWTLVWSNAELGVIEAWDETEIFRFVDDVAVRVRARETGSGEAGSVVDVRSVSRVGGRAQLSAYRTVVSDLKLAYAQFLELEVFSRFSPQLDEETRATLERGRRVREVLKQGEGDPVPPAEQVATLLAATGGVLQPVPVERVGDAERRIRDAVRDRLPELCRRIEAGEEIGPDEVRQLRVVAREAVSEAWSD